MTARPDIAELIERVRSAGDPDAARELAAIVERVLATPDKRVAAAFGLSRRGGVPTWRKQQLQERDEDIRALAAEIGDDLPTATRIVRVRDLVKRAERSRSLTDPADPQQILVARLVASGEKLPRRSRLFKIIDRKK